MFLFQNMRIANAYELAAGNDTSDVSFDQGKCVKVGLFLIVLVRVFLY